MHCDFVEEPPGMSVHTHMVEFPCGRSRANAYLSVPEGGDVPGVLVLPAWWGLTDFFKGVCVRLAKSGFVALAPDIYHGKTATTIAEAKRLRSKLNSTKLRIELSESTNYLRATFAETGDKIGVLGFSLGANWALWLAMEKPKEVAAVVTFYGARKGDYKKAHAAFLGHYAEDDRWTPINSVRELEKDIRAAGKEVEFHVYPSTTHWFFEENQPDAYNPKAANLAWKRTLEFLHSRLDLQ
jgi:carboxymethylenebutenolidase